MGVFSICSLDKMSFTWYWHFYHLSPSPYFSLVYNRKAFMQRIFQTIARSVSFSDGILFIVRFLFSTLFQLSLGGQAARLPHTTDVHPDFPTALRILVLTDLMVAPSHLGHSLERLPDGIIGTCTMLYFAYSCVLTCGSCLIQIFSYLYLVRCFRFPCIAIFHPCSVA